MVRGDQRGNFYVACAGDGKVEVVDSKGGLVGEMLLAQNQESGSAIYEAIPLGNGNVLVSIADAVRVMELDQEGEVVWELGTEDLPGIHMTRISGVQRLSNGNTVICGAGREKSQVHALEVTFDHKIVWQLTNASFKNISRIQVLPSEACGGLTGSIY